MIAHATTRSGWLTIKEVSEQLGLSPSLMRLWESRYGWPSPRRTPSGQRRFSPADIEEIRQVQVLLQAGRSIGSLIVDGRPELPTVVAKPREPLAERLLARLPQPERPLARALRDDLVAALRARDSHRALGDLQRAVRDCAPGDRAAAAWYPTLALIEAWAEAGQPLADAQRLRETIRSMGGPERWAGPVTQAA